MCTVPVTTKGISDLSLISRKLSSVFLISSRAFAAASPTQQTEVLTQTGGLPVVFVPSFHELQNSAAIRDKLLKGEDVSLELEFNEIVVNEEELRGLRLVSSLLEKLAKIGPNYPWLAPVDHSKTISFHPGVISRNGYNITEEAALSVWKKASKIWGNLAANRKRVLADNAESMNTGQHGNRWVTVTKSQVVVGCQTLKRSEIEFVAAHYNWKPNI
jgi:hypothetical protein